MPPIETIARPVRNRISVAVPKEYHAYSFRVVLVPIEPQQQKVRTVHAVPGLSFKMSDADMFSDDSDSWEACVDEQPSA